MADGVDVGVYYFPQYQPDRRNDQWHGPGWTEWELVRRAEPRFPGHAQPKVPLRGYVDDSHPAVAAQTIELARAHGVGFFIFDWHWYEDGPFLERALNEGFLQAANADLPFAIMWANQDWDNLFPAKLVEGRTILADGAVSVAAFAQATDYVIDRYLSQPHYYRVTGGAYFSIFDPIELAEGLGGAAEAGRVLADFRARARAAGAGELHLNAIAWGLGENVPPHQRGFRPLPDSLISALGFDSVTSYNWFQHVPFRGELTADYEHITAAASGGWPKFAETYSVPYYPNVLMGWDASPRAVQSEEFRPSITPSRTSS